MRAAYDRDRKGEFPVRPSLCGIEGEGQLVSFPSQPVRCGGPMKANVDLSGGFGVMF